MNQVDDRDKSILWARRLLAREDWVIFDTETTGLSGAEIVQIGLLSPQGEVLLDSLVRPRLSIRLDATAIHGITALDVAYAPDLTELLPRMEAVMHGEERNPKTVVVYNAAFDRGVLFHCLTRRFVPENAASPLVDTGRQKRDAWMDRCRWDCAMQRYSNFVGEWNNWRGSYRWQKLPAGDHTAIGDCRATLWVIQEMATAKLSSEGAL
jgi:DNA polymerase-3 subunit epsilon